MWKIVKDIGSATQIDVIDNNNTNINFISSYFKLFEHWNNSISDILLLDDMKLEETEREIYSH